MRIDVIKGRTEDRIHIVRDDGSTADAQFPKKGPFPHDLVHVAVEEALGMDDAFWGMVASGRHPEDIAALAAMHGHASASKPNDPAPSIVHLIQAERLVECFEVEIWDGPTALDQLQSVADAGFSQSRVPSIKLTQDLVALIRDQLLALHTEWMAIPLGGTLTCEWR
jgi:hypothetical protein